MAAMIEKFQSALGAALLLTWLEKRRNIMAEMFQSALGAALLLTVTPLIPALAHTYNAFLPYPIFAPISSLPFVLLFLLNVNSFNECQPKRISTHLFCYLSHLSSATSFQIRSPVYLFAQRFAPDFQTIKDQAATHSNDYPNQRRRLGSRLQ